MEQDYLALMERVWEEGDLRSDRTGVGTRSLFGEQLKFDLKQGFPLLTTKKVHTKSILTELQWFLEGRTDNQWLVDRGCTIWDSWATEEQTMRFNRSKGDLGPIYGHQWRNFGETVDDGWIIPGVDQVANLIDGLKRNPDSRRHIVTAWNPLEVNEVTLPPCHTLWQMYVHSTKGLSCHLYQRSADLFLGVPFNIASYAFLTHLIAQLCDLDVDTLTISYGDVHLYLNHEEQIKTQLSRTPKPFPDAILDPIVLELSAFTADSFKIINYDPYPAISAPVAV